MYWELRIEIARISDETLADALCLGQCVERDEKSDCRETKLEIAGHKNATSDDIALSIR